MTRTLKTKCPKCGSRNFTITIFSFICGDCYFEEKYKVKDMENSKTTSEEWEIDFRKKFVKKFCIAERDEITNNYSGLGIQVNGIWEIIKSFISSLILQKQKEAIEPYKEALIWCSGSEDFQLEGKARKGWEKLCLPLLKEV